MDNEIGQYCFKHLCISRESTQCTPGNGKKISGSRNSPGGKVKKLKTVENWILPVLPLTYHSYMSLIYNLQIDAFINRSVLGGES